MESSLGVVLLLFLSLIGAILMGFPVAFTIGGVGVLTLLLGQFLGIADFNLMSALPPRIFGIALTSDVLISVPLFIFMGVMLERSRVAENLLITISKIFGRLSGGMAIAVILVGALLAASTGVVGATVVTMGLLSLPAMINSGYNKSLSCGTICASGTLGQIIPPSIVLIILGDQISNAYVSAQRDLGNWSPEPVSVGDLFAGALIPGLILVVFYCIYLVIYALLRPKQMPPTLEIGERIKFSDLINALLAPLGLVLAVLGTILGGIATPTEGAAVGAVGSILLASDRITRENPTLMANFVRSGTREGHKQPVAWWHPCRLLLTVVPVQPTQTLLLAITTFIAMMGISASFNIRVGSTSAGTLDNIASVVAAGSLVVFVVCLALATARLWALGILQRVAISATESSSMIFLILVGATFFSLAFRGFHGDEIVHQMLTSLPGGAFSAIFVVLFIIFMLGFFIDFIEITFVVVPVVAPVLLTFEGVSPVWLGIMFALVLQTSFLTPPFGFALFYLRGVAPSSVSTLTIYNGVVPFIILQLLVVALVGAFPFLSDWLPFVIYGSDYGIL